MRRPTSKVFSWGLAALGLWACNLGNSGEAVVPRENPSFDPQDKSHPRDVIEPAPSALSSLLAYEDTDGDRRITVLDEGAKWFLLPVQGGAAVRVEGTYHLANLVQELFLTHREKRTTISLEHVFEAPVPRLSRLIRTRYWSSLTRRIDEGSLTRVLADSKMDSRRQTPETELDWPASWPAECTEAPLGRLPQFLYVPHDDEAAHAYYSAMVARHPGLVVCRLPEKLTPKWVRGLSATAQRGSRHGLLSLALHRDERGELSPVPYVVPGGRFNELYGWDSYFHVLGLLHDERRDLARAIVDNQLYEVRHYGKVLNANRTYYLTRSQPPLLSSAVRAVFEASGQVDTPRHEDTPRQDDVDWLSDAVHLLEKEYATVWGGAKRSTPLCTGNPRVCLSTYHGHGLGEPPEVEPGHFSWLYEKASRDSAWDAEEYRLRYLARELPQERLAELDEYFLHDRAMRESGHDTTYRWNTEQGERCADHATIDLNALLFKYELDLAYLQSRLGKPKEVGTWCARASARKTLIQKYLFNGQVFVDFLLERDDDGVFTSQGELRDYLSATMLWPLWASADSPCKTSEGQPLSLLLDRSQAEGLVSRALQVLEQPGGLAATSRESSESIARPTSRQWDFPFGWAPHQVLAWEGLLNFGFDSHAHRLAYRWLYMIVQAAHDYHGTVPEKFDVVRRSHQVFAEYGNVGTEFSYITEEGFGWMNASFQLGAALLPLQMEQNLEALVPPEQLPLLHPQVAEE